jgi:cytochrome c
MWSTRVKATVVAIAVLIAGSAATLGYRHLQDRAARKAALLTAGDPTRGPDLIRQFGCAACHRVAGVSGATGRVGPRLSAIPLQGRIAGALPNTPHNLVQWIVDPKAHKPDTTMPRTGISEQDARDVAAYLFSLR